MFKGAIKIYRNVPGIGMMVVFFIENGGAVLSNRNGGNEFLSYIGKKSLCQVNVSVNLSRHLNRSNKPMVKSLVENLWKSQSEIRNLLRL